MRINHSVACVRKRQSNDYPRLIYLSLYVIDMFSPHVSICSIYKYIEKSKNINYFEKKNIFFLFFIVCIKKKFKFAKELNKTQTI